jgi:SAM-dependent methyltransferase
LSHDDILDLVFSPWPTQALFAASRLGIFTTLAQEPMTAAELGRRVGTRSHAFPALLDACVAMGLLHRTEDRYANSHLSDAHLVEGRPLYMGDFIDLLAFESPQWNVLYDALANKPHARPQTNESDFGRRRFTLAMHNLAMNGEATALAAAVDLDACKSMADVGCGSGMYSVALCCRWPGLRVTLLDHPDVLDTARDIVRQHGLADRIELRPADMTSDPYGQDLDAVLLSDVLYQNKATCLTILRSAYDALADGGRLVIRGYYCAPGGSESAFGALFALKLQLENPDREPISVATLSDWLGQTGFRKIHAFALTPRSTCLIATR